jgi:hypothetical protein
MANSTARARRRVRRPAAVPVEAAPAPKKKGAPAKKAEASAKPRKRAPRKKATESK